MPEDPAPNGTKRPRTRRRVVLAVILVGVAAIVVVVVTFWSGPHPRFDGQVESLSLGTVGGFQDISIGLGGVSRDGASLVVFGNGRNETLDLEVGEAGESQGLHLRLCGVWVDKHLALIPAPGSYASEAYFVVGGGDSAPDCPEKL